MLSHLIDRIEVDRDYHISVHFYVAMEDFQEAVKTENVSIFEADRCYFAAAEWSAKRPNRSKWGEKITIRFPRFSVGALSKKTSDGSE